MKRNNANDWPAPAKSLRNRPQFGPPVRHIPRDAAESDHNNPRMLTMSMERRVIGTIGCIGGGKGFREGAAKKMTPQIPAGRTAARPNANHAAADAKSR